MSHTGRVAVGVITTGGFALAYVGVAWLIEEAYHGRSFDLLNGIITGQATHPVEHYLHLWRYLATLVGLAVFVTGGLAWISRRAVGRLDPVYRWLGVRSAWPWRSVAATAGVLTLVGGALEGGYRMAWYLLAHNPSREFAWETVWMAPWAALVAGGLLLVAWRGLAMVLGPAGALFRAPAVVVGAWTAWAAWGVLATAPVRVALWARVVLVLGLAMRGGSWSREHPERARRLLAPTAAVAVLLLLVGTGLGVRALPARSELRKLAALPPVEGRGPDILLVILDTVRAANLSIYGYPRETTPRLEARMDAHTVSFERAVSPSSWTLPSHASMFTGRWPLEHGARHGRRLGDDDATLAEVLGQAGYQTAGFSANYANATEATGLARGFARFEDFPITWGRFVISSHWGRVLGRPLWRLYGDRARIGMKTATENTDDVLRWFDRSRLEARPYFVFVNYMDAHAPYRSPPRYRARFPSDVPVVLRKAPGLTEADMEGTRAAYDAAIAYIDDEIDRLLDGLEERGAPPSLVIVTSDHGELFGEHGLIDHANALYDPLLHVPLLIYGVPASEHGGPRRIPQRVSLVDLAPTVAEMALGRAAGELGGRSLQGLWGGGDTVSSAAFSSHEASPFHEAWEPASLGPMRSVYDGDFHLVRNGDGSVELFDPATDPAELRNRVGDPILGGRMLGMSAQIDSLVKAMLADSIRTN